MTGRHLKLTPDLASSLARDIAAGLPRHVAAARAGIGTSTLEGWISRARTLRSTGDTDDQGGPCATCGAQGDEPCTTGTGNVASGPHAGRTAPVPGGDPELFADFLEGIERAEADAHARNLMLIQQAATGGTWQAAAWFLERRYPEQYARRTLELSGPNKGPIAVTLDGTGLADNVSTDRLIELARRLDDGDDD
jgi:hypothetical protein